MISLNHTERRDLFGHAVFSEKIDFPLEFHDNQPVCANPNGIFSLDQLHRLPGGLPDAIIPPRSRPSGNGAILKNACTFLHSPVSRRLAALRAFKYTELISLDVCSTGKDHPQFQRISC